MKNYKIDFSGVDWQHPVEGVAAKEFTEDGKKVRLVRFDHRFVEEGWCLRGHIGWVVEGECSIDYSGRLIAYRAGDGIFIPSGDEHRHRLSVEQGQSVTVFLVDDAL